MTNAKCPQNIIISARSDCQSLNFLFEESGDKAVVKVLKEDEEDLIQFKEEVSSECGAETMKPELSETMAWMAKKILANGFDMFGDNFADSDVPTSPLCAQKKTDLPTPLSECRKKLDVLRPQDDAIPIQRIEVCAVQQITVDHAPVSSPDGGQNQPSTKEESSRENRGPPQAQPIVCAPVSRDPRISRNSIGEKINLLVVSPFDEFIKILNMDILLCLIFL